MDEGQNSGEISAQKPGVNRVLLIVLAVLYVGTLAIFIYAEWAADPASAQWWMMALNALILSIPLVLLYGSIYVLATAWREHSRGGQVNPRLGKIIHWAPRVAAILIILFTSLFSLDVFGTGAPPLQVLGDFVMHNLPSIGMIVLLVFAWKRPVVGFAAFLIAGVLFALLFVRDMYALPNLLLFVFPILLVAFLFYADWKWLAAPPAPTDTATVT
jgi:hypothetical protein